MKLTTAFLAIVVMAVIVYDVIAYWIFGKDATVSADILRFSREHPIVPLLIGIVLGHLFWPQN